MASTSSPLAVYKDLLTSMNSTLVGDGDNQFISVVEGIFDPTSKPVRTLGIEVLGTRGDRNVDDAIVKHLRLKVRGSFKVGTTAGSGATVASGQSVEALEVIAAIEDWFETFSFNEVGVVRLDFPEWSVTNDIAGNLGSNGFVDGEVKIEINTDRGGNSEDPTPVSATYNPLGAVTITWSGPVSVSGVTSAGELTGCTGTRELTQASTTVTETSAMVTTFSVTAGSLASCGGTDDKVHFTNANGAIVSAVTGLPVAAFTNLDLDS